jgi:DNA-binding CsgD family transcriptional regulator
MASRNYVSHRPKAHAWMNQDSGRWELVRVVPLGSREQQCLRLLAEGLESKAIARRMHVSINTVQSYCTELLFKFELSGIRKLILLALDLYPRNPNIRGRDRSSTRDSSVPRLVKAPRESCRVDAVTGTASTAGAAPKSRPLTSLQQRRSK